MKHFFLSLFLLIGIALSGQVDLKCYTYDSFQSSDCYGCGIRTGHFSGIIVTTNGIKIALHKPVKISYRASNVFFEDPFGNKYNCSITSVRQSLPLFVSDCFVEATGGGVEDIQLIYQDDSLQVVIDGLESNKIQFVAEQGLQGIQGVQGEPGEGLPSGGTSGQIITKVDNVDYNTQWSDLGFTDKTVRMFLPLGGGSANAHQIGMSIAAFGKATAVTFENTSLVRSIHKVAYNNTTGSVSAVAGFQSDRTYFLRGDSPRLGGFKLSITWGPHVGFTSITNHRGYCGAIADITAPTDVEPSSRANIIGIGWDNADTQVQLMHNDGSGDTTKIPLGVNFPRPTIDLTNFYKLDLWCEPNTSSVTYKVTNITTGDIATGALTTNIPLQSILLGVMGCVSSAGSSRNTLSSALSRIVLETNY